MKHIITLFILVVLTACSKGNTENRYDDDHKIDESSSNTKAETVRKKIRSEAESSTLEKDTDNFKDENGLKQGRWVLYNKQGKLISEKNYQNDTLNGYWYEQNGMETEGYYKKGLKNGYFRTYYDKELKKVMVVSLYSDDKALWHAHPASDAGLLFPAKGIDVNMDSIYVKVPHYNGSIWYEGLFVNKEYRGIHKIYEKNGTLKGVVNYSDSSVIVYNSKGDIIESSSIGNYKKMKR